jgi:hypothetical protein
MATMRQFTGQQANSARSDLQKRQVRAIPGTVQGNPNDHGLAIHLYSEVPTQLNYLVGVQLPDPTAWPFIGLSTRAIMDHLTGPCRKVHTRRRNNMQEAGNNPYQHTRAA